MPWIGHKLKLKPTLERLDSERREQAEDIMRVGSRVIGWFEVGV